MSKIISIINQKGGVGKTTTAVTVAACLAERNYKTLLIDADPQANASLSLGFKARNDKYSTYDLLIKNELYKNCIKNTNYNNFEIITSNEDLYSIDLDLQELENKEYVLKNKIKNFENLYDFIIIDSPPNLGLLNINIMSATKQIIVPLKADYLSLKGLAILLGIYSRMKTRLNKDLNILGILLTMYNHGTILSKDIEFNLKTQIGDLLFKTKIPQNIKIAESPSFSKPIIYYDSKSAGSIYYREFVNELLERINSEKYLEVLNYDKKF